LRQDFLSPTRFTSSTTGVKSTAVEKIEKATAGTAGLPRAAEAEAPTPEGRPREG
jgi:hypothetical protein